VNIPPGATAPVTPPSAARRDSFPCFVTETFAGKVSVEFSSRPPPAWRLSRCTSCLSKETEAVDPPVNVAVEPELIDTLLSVKCVLRP
jgi:hypothetical protein